MLNSTPFAHRIGAIISMASCATVFALSVPDVLVHASPYPNGHSSVRLSQQVDSARVPFSVGEKIEYDVQFGSITVGKGSMEVHPFEDVRGYKSWHTALRVRGRVVFFSVDDLHESWFDSTSLASRRFHQNIRQTGYKKERTIEIFPERAIFKDGIKDEMPSVSDPLDDASFLYFARTIPLEVGQTYKLPRYYNPASNPVEITVLRREQVKTKAGTFNTIVLQPRFKSGGMFGEGGKAEVWLADDSTRIMVKMKSSLKIGSLGLNLTKYTPGTR